MIKKDFIYSVAVGAIRNVLKNLQFNTNALIGPNCFCWVKTVVVRFKLDFYGLIFMIWTFPK